MIAHIFMMESCEYLDLSESALTICLMLKWANLFDGYFAVSLSIIGRAARRISIGISRRGLPDHPIGALAYIAEARITRPHIECLTPHYLNRGAT